MFPYRGVLFDFYGTLTTAVQRGPGHLEVARILGCDPAEMVAVLDRSFHARAQGEFGNAADTLRWVCAQAGGDPSPGRVSAALDARVAALWTDTRLRPDAVATLRALRLRGLRLAVVSDCGYELPALLPRLPVALLLDAAVYSVHIGQCKPHPAMYLAACGRLGLAPEDCLYVGDGGSQELTGAARLGMTAVRLAAPDLVDHLVFDADRDWTGPTVTDLKEVVRLVDRMPAFA